MENKGIAGNLHPSAQLALLLVIIIVAVLVIMPLGMLVFALINGADVRELLAADSEFVASQNLNFMRFSQILGHVGLFLVPSLVFGWLVGLSPARYYQAKKWPVWSASIVSVLLVFAALPIVNLLMEFNSGMQLPAALSGVEEWMRASEDSAKKITQRFLQVETWQAWLFNIFMIAIIPAVGEELIFRGALQNVFKRWSGSIHLAVWVSAFIFSAIHMQFFGFLPRLFLGAILGYMMVYSGNIWIPILAHFVNNAAAVTIHFLHHNNYIHLDIENVGLGQWALPMGAVSLILVVVLFRMLYRIPQKESSKLSSDVSE